MKRKLLILNLSFIALLLFSIVVQSVDSICHLQEKFSQKECHHTYNSSAEITHQHHGFDNCYVCQFQFSSSITPKDFSFQFYTWNTKIPYSFANTETIISFSGSLYSHRGPPNCI